MKQKKPSRVNSSLYQAVLWPTTVLSLGLAAPVYAQDGAVVVEEIIVSARRQEESSQDIPIAITVVDQNTMSNTNVFSAIDLKQFTPSLSTNTRFGPDQASFAIRGFTQELRTTASVGFYFAEVVAPRGGGSVTSGDGAGPGAFFDLQNVLVLKGPQGTLFGRNTTGGAILLTPQEPTNELEGYLEGSAGDYDMQRVQGVINVPVSDTVRARFGVDTMQRDGYLENNSGFGPDELGDTDYISARASVIWDVTDTVENYTIFSYTDSENSGIVSSLFACNPAGGLFAGGCANQLQRQDDDFYAVQSRFEDPKSELKQWQVINKTSWSATDDLTVRNILSYSEMEQRNNTSVYGINYLNASAGSYYSFTESADVPGYPTNSQTSFVEEFQLQGYAMDGSLTWQAGLYFENSRPDGPSGSQAVNYMDCASYDPANPAGAVCLGMDVAGALGWSGITRQVAEVEFTSKAVYTEATYEINDQWKLTGGLRYTNDKSEGTAESTIWGGFPSQLIIVGPGPTFAPSGAAAGNPSTENCVYTTADANCVDSLEQDSEAVTGLVDVDYFLTQDVMLYAKYSRGYRQGSVSMFAGEGFRTFEPEQVDAYELGTKTTFGGPVPGTFNAAFFYNDLQDQQIQYGYLAPGLAPTQAIVNAGKSVIQGIEVEASLQLLEDLMLNLSYTYLDTELKDAIDIPSTASYTIINTATPGSDLTFSPKHSVVVGLNYRLPLPAEVGDVALGATYSYTGEQYSTGEDASPYALLDSYDVVNLNANWNAIFGSGFDAGLFVTNALDEEYTTYVSGLYNSMGFETRMTGVPKMWGAKLRYNF